MFFWKDKRESQTLTKADIDRKIQDHYRSIIPLIEETKETAIKANRYFSKLERRIDKFGSQAKTADQERGRLMNEIKRALEGKISDIENSLKGMSGCEQGEDIVIDNDTDIICTSTGYIEKKKESKTPLRELIEEVILKSLYLKEDSRFKRGLSQIELIELVREEINLLSKKASESYVRSIIYALIDNNFIRRYKPEGKKRFRYYAI